MTRLVLQEYKDGDDQAVAAPICEYVLTTSGSLRVRHGSDNNNLSSSFFSRPWRSSPTQIVKDLFLPIGYPHSVDPSYLPYQLYDGLQGLCSYWRGVVSTKAVLIATGVGNAEATAMSAALNWAIRDGTAMIGGLVYSYACSTYFDSHPLEFRLFLADVVNDLALTLDMLAPTCTTATHHVLALSTMLKTICGITAGATKGRITHHFARHNGNMADLSAKESTQETLVSLLGMVGGVWVAKLLEHHQSFFWTWLLFGTLTLLHVWANYKAVTVIKLTTFNPERTRALFQKLIGRLADVVNTRQFQNFDKQQAKTAMHSLPAPDDIQESMWASVQTLLFPTIHTAMSLDKAAMKDCTLGVDDDGNDIQEQRMPHVLGYDGGQHIYLWLKVGATDMDEIQAYVHALLLQELMCPMIKHREPQQYTPKLVEQTFQTVQTLFGPDLLSILEEKGWDVRGRCYFGFAPTRLKVVMEESNTKKDK
jgi:hypothetical protein